ncbi:methyl-accepting chemotaxis protein [Soehngenia saccharolytica]|nr:methyl-accepting chemotaxis protein [Soehngenia saccharolytica]
MDLLEAFVKVAPYINELTNTDFSVSVCDLEKCLAYVPGKTHDHKLKVGSEHVLNSASYDCIKKREKIVRRVDSSVFGFPYIAIAIPIFNDDDEIIGSVTFTENTQTQDEMINLSKDLYRSIEKLKSITETININSTELDNLDNSLANVIKESNSKLQDTMKTLEFIKSISQNTNILGINAAIEASRFGNEGRGFGVIAQEIRSFSEVIKKYVKDVNITTKELSDAINSLNELFDEITKISLEEGEITKEINSLVSELNNRSEKLKDIISLIE